MLMQDVRYVCRKLITSPGFAIAAVVTLALGIGLNTAIFSVVYAVLLRSLPLNEPDSLVVSLSVDLKHNTSIDTVSYPDYLDWKAEGDIFRQVAAYTDPPFDLAAEGEPERIRGASVSEDFFKVMDVSPLLGRAFLSEDHLPAAGKVAVLSHKLWQGRFGGDRQIIGKAVTLSGNVHTVIGVMSPEAHWPPGVALWVPLPFRDTPPPSIMRRDNYAWRVVGRLQPGVSLGQAQARVRAVAQRIAGENPTTRGFESATVIPIHDYLVGPNTRRALWVLMGSVAFVLLIACANVANLLLVRSVQRRGEFALRAALGASPLRLVRLVIVEGVIVALLGGACGVLLATWGVDLLAALTPQDVPRLDEVDIDRCVLGFALGLSLVNGLLLSLAPALQSSKVNLYSTLRRVGQGSTAGTAGHRFRRGLVVSELAVSLVLLVGSILLIKSFGHLLRVEPGFTTENLLTFQVSLPESRYPPEGANVADFYERTLERLNSLPGVSSATAASVLPLAGGDYTGRAFVIEGHSTPPAGPEYTAKWQTVTPGYFTTTGIPVLKGRCFTEHDGRNSPRVAIINQAFARRMFPNENAIGKRIRSWRDENIFREIVGVARNVSFYSLADVDRPLIYVPYRQDVRASMMLAIRTMSDPLTIADAARNTIRSMDADLAVARLATMEQAAEASLSPLRLTTQLIAGFAVLALILAVLGVYGVISYSVSQTTHDIGVRMALGAQARDVLKSIITQGMVLTGAGIGIGLLSAIALTHLLSGLLFQVSATDPVVFLGAAAMLTLTALIASYLPARRATKIDPAIALRCE
ncbi:MAG: ABC transporter permease [Planctomycetota bacterium]|jgi:putative ABC transport system permease protein